MIVQIAGRVLKFLMNFNLAKELSVTSGLCIIGRNPENADYINREGNIYGAVAYVIATCPLGYRWAHNWKTKGHSEKEQIERAEILMAKMQKVLDAGGHLNEDYWYRVDPAYGSEAYQIEGIEAERAYMDRFDE